MKTRPAHLFLFVISLSACSGGGSTAADAGPDAGDTDTGDPVPLTAVDLLVMVDNSVGMAQEQSMLAQQMFELVGALMHPDTGATYAAIDDIRVAAVTSNMGLSSDGVNNDEHWPYDPVPDACAGFGDDGVFQEIDGYAIESPDGGTAICPELSGPWAETTADAPNDDLPVLAACLVNQGSGGCGWEQHLASAARGLSREDQAGFSRGNAVLAVIVASDEDDCSLSDGASMFGLIESSPQAINLLCGEHPEWVFPPSHFYDVLTGLKPSADAVVYAAIVGAPYGDQPGTAACQGPGDAITGCLDQEEMQLFAEQPNAPGDDTWFYRPACTRSVGETQVTKGWPGRRFVELANDFGANGYVYSICNADWSPAFDALSTMIAGKLAP